MRSLILAAAALLGSRLGAQSSAPPQNSTPDSATANAADVVSFAVPDSPALVFLGVTPARITRPGTGRSLGVSLLSGLDALGAVRQGFAVDAAPFVYAFSSSLDAYQRSRGAFMKTNLNLSLGFARTGGSAGATDIALGARTALFDRGDPLRDAAFVRRIGARLGECAPGTAAGGAPPDAYSRESTLQCMARKTDSVARNWARSHWNATSLSVGAATAIRLEQSVLRRSRGTGAQLWGAFGQRIGGWGQGILYGAFRSSRAARDTSYQAASAGARLVVGGARMNAFVEGITESRWDASDGVAKSVTAWSAGVEFMTAPAIWVSTGIGTAYRAAKAPAQVVLFANVHWGISQKSRLAPGL